MKGVFCLPLVLLHEKVRVRAALGNWIRSRFRIRVRVRGSNLELDPGLEVEN